MDQSQKNTSSRKVFIDYIPAELQGTKGENWRVVYYHKVPGEEKLKRFRLRVRKISNRKERIKLAKRICAEVNKKLGEGWSPFYSNNDSKEYTLLKDAIEKYNNQNKKFVEKGQLRADSNRSYKSMAKQLLDYLNYSNNSDLMCAQFNRQFVTNYVDYVYFDKKRTARTANNYMKWCITFANFLVDRGFLSNNSIEGMPIFKQTKKRREIIDEATRNSIFKYLKKENPQYLTLCLLIYFCFIRRKEITMLRVSHVKLEKGIIVIPSTFSKNGKEESVTIPKMFIERLTKHIGKSPGNYYLFSKNDFKPGALDLHPRKITYIWDLMRKELGFKKEYQFYSLKDTGITQLFRMGVPTIKIRDQARHQDLKTTEIYTPRNYDKDDFIADLDFDF